MCIGWFFKSYRRVFQKNTYAIQKNGCNLWIDSTVHTINYQPIRIQNFQYDSTRKGTKIMKHLIDFVNLKTRYGAPKQTKFLFLIYIYTCLPIFDGHMFFFKKSKKTSKEAIVGRARLWIPISFLCQLNKTIILFGSNFGYLRK